MTNTHRTIRSRSTFLFAAAALLAGGLLLGACTPVGVAAGAGASAGVAASEERGLDGAATDTRIRFEINDLWFKNDVGLITKVELQIYEGRILISGRVPTQDMADTAIRLAWQPDGVNEVINELQVSEGGDIESFARDNVINARLDAELLFDNKVLSINYSTRAVGGTVYLLGVAQDQAELDRVFDIARNIPDVRSVISHVLLKSDPRRNRPATAGPPGKA